jgi:hypothetical protein
LFDGFHTMINTNMKINEVITKELAGTCQIQREQAISPLVVSSHQLPRKVAQIQSSQAQQKQQQKPPVSTQAIPDQIKHKLIQDKLTKQLMRQSNIVMPTSDDIRIARDRVATALKRADLEYNKHRN